MAHTVVTDALTKSYNGVVAADSTVSSPRWQKRGWRRCLPRLG